MLACALPASAQLSGCCAAAKGKLAAPGKIVAALGVAHQDAAVKAELPRLARFFALSLDFALYEDGPRPGGVATRRTVRADGGGTVYLGKQLVRRELYGLDEYPAAVVGAMAHLWAHVHQQATRSRLKGKYRGLHADYLAGVYLGRTARAKVGEIRAVARRLFEDREEARAALPFWHARTHGSPAERVAALLAGFAAENTHRTWTVAQASAAGIEAVASAKGALSLRPPKQCSQCAGRGCVSKTGACPTCGEKGVEVCPDCKGRGMLGGGGIRRCQRCKGEGELPCPTCKGVGGTTRAVRCPRCRGRG
jgi:hypothetical protein